MISFNCSGCGKEFNVPDHFAGKSATCKKCGGSVIVPGKPPKKKKISQPVNPASNIPAPAALPVESEIKKLPVRTRRLMADVRQIREAFSGDGFIRLVETEGDPAEVYRIEYRIRGIETMKSEEPVFREHHVVEIRMTSDYPRFSPACKMLTPIFHPNIDEASICVGDHWTAGERLVDLVVRIGEMIAYQAYNIKSPLNGHAAMWADLNPSLLPIDGRNLHPAALERAG